MTDKQIETKIKELRHLMEEIIEVGSYLSTEVYLAEQAIKHLDEIEQILGITTTDKHNFDKDIDVPSKQITIDGVDVSGCGYFDDNECMIAGFGINEAILYCHCKSNPNCYYKQLKQSEQRIVELNKTIQAKEQKLEKIKSYCVEQNLKADWTACEILKIIEE